MKLSQHFDDSEFADHRTGAIVVDPLLIDCLERLRTHIGRPLRIVSGFRTAATNARVGGARNSMHLKGKAADIPRGYCRRLDAELAGFTGIGLCDGWVVHVDVRPGRPVIFKDC